MSQELTLRYMKVLIAIQENPLGTYDELAKRTGFAKSVVHDIIQKLLDLNTEITRRKPYFHIVANPDIQSLRLEKVDILIHADSEKKLHVIEKLCDEHPYTLYNARCYGDINGTLTQFRVPKGTSNQIQNLLQKVPDRGLIDNFSILPFIRCPSIYTTVNVDHWIPSAYRVSPTLPRDKRYPHTTARP
ncbi:MAG: winged helix-turn-helix domain-containing protein, partial [Candidatus Hodarchaeota archaeon]